MKRNLTIACMVALASLCSLSQPLRAEDVPVRKAIYTSADPAVPAVNVSQVVVGAPVAYRPYRAYRPYYAPYRAYYPPYVARPYYGPYVAPYRAYRYGAYYAPYRYYSGYRGFYW
jgi:hypothetical protein